LALAGAFCYQALIGMKGIPSHARTVMVAQSILGMVGVKVDITNPEALADMNDERELLVATWCAS
jgi:hypothetical protein